MKSLGSILAFLISLVVYPQDQPISFSEAISSRILKYNYKIESALLNNDRERVNFLFDSLFNNHLRNTYIENLKLNKINGGILTTDDLKIPFVLITKSSYFFQTEEEISMINDVARRFKNQIKIIVLFWGDSKTSSKAARNFNNNVIVTYVDERENKNDYFIATYKHSFGTPACFFVTANKQLSSIDKAFNLTSKNLDINSLEKTNRQLALLLFKEDRIHEGIITTRDNKLDR